MNDVEKTIINIGVIGCGGIAKNHVFSISLIENNARKIWKPLGKHVKVRLYALADIDPDAIDGFSKVFPVPRVFKGPTAGYDLIADKDVHAVFVLVPTVDHLDYVLKAAEAGKHVFCEKPIAFSPNDVLKMIAARDKHKVVIQVGLVFRSAPQIAYLKHLYEQNKDKWGKPMNIVFRDSQEKPYKGSEEVHNSTWRGDKTKAHAGILFEHTIHDIDGMVSVFGEIEDVFAKINYHDRDGIETSVASVLTFKNGMSLSVNSMWNDIDYSQRRMEIFFENAFIMVTVDERAGTSPDGRALKMVRIITKQGKEPEVELDDDEMDALFREQIGMGHASAEVPGPYYYEDLRFVNAIVEGTVSPVGLEPGYYVQKVIEACYESSRRGAPVKVDDFDPA